MHRRWDYHSFPEVTSTMDVARDLWNKGSQNSLWVRADKQTNGRGRQGRPWVSDPANFYGTFVFQTTLTQNRQFIYSFAASLAVREALLSFGLKDIFLKWPNDVWASHKKIAGLLLESIDPQTMMIGIGVNLEPTDVSNSAYGVTSFLEESNQILLPEELGHKLLTILDFHLEIAESADYQSLLERWYGVCMHRDMSVTIGSGQAQRGICRGIDGQGALILEDPITQEIQKIYAGDVFFQDNLQAQE